MCKVLVLPVTDMNSTFGESVYVDVRAKRKPDRTPERVSELSAQVRTLGRAVAFWHGALAFCLASKGPDDWTLCGSQHIALAGAQCVAEPGH